MNNNKMGGNFTLTQKQQILNFNQSKESRKQALNFLQYCLDLAVDLNATEKTLGELCIYLAPFQSTIKEEWEGNYDSVDHLLSDLVKIIVEEEDMETYLDYLKDVEKLNLSKGLKKSANISNMKKALLELTKGGEEIFRFYNVGKENEQKIDTGGNYMLEEGDFVGTYSEERNCHLWGTIAKIDGEFRQMNGVDAVHWIMNKNGITEAEAIQKIDKDMNLDFLEIFLNESM